LLLYVFFWLLISSFLQICCPTTFENPNGNHLTSFLLTIYLLLSRLWAVCAIVQPSYVSQYPECRVSSSPFSMSSFAATVSTCPFITASTTVAVGLLYHKKGIQLRNAEHRQKTNSLQCSDRELSPLELVRIHDDYNCSLSSSSRWFIWWIKSEVTIPPNSHSRR